MTATVHLHEAPEQPVLVLADHAASDANPSYGQGAVCGVIRAQWGPLCHQGCRGTCWCWQGCTCHLRTKHCQPVSVGRPACAWLLVKEAVRASAMPPQAAYAACSTVAVPVPSALPCCNMWQGSTDQLQQTVYRKHLGCRGAQGSGRDVCVCHNS